MNKNYRTRKRVGDADVDGVIMTLEQVQSREHACNRQTFGLKWIQGSSLQEFIPSYAGPRLGHQALPVG